MVGMFHISLINKQPEESSFTKWWILTSCKKFHSNQRMLFSSTKQLLLALHSCLFSFAWKAPELTYWKICSNRLARRTTQVAPLRYFLWGFLMIKCTGLSCLMFLSLNVKLEPAEIRALSQEVRIYVWTSLENRLHDDIGESSSHINQQWHTISASVAES